MENLSYSIPDNAPYEIDKLQLPKVIEVSMGFKYVGNKLQTMQGKHFDLPWLQGTDYTLDEKGSPNRTTEYNDALSVVAPTVTATK